MIRRFSVFAVAVLALAVSGAAGAGDVSAPTRLVAGFQAGLLNTMKQARALGVRGRFEALSPLIASRFHLPLMIATATAPHWRGAPADQQKALLEAFARMSAAYVATLFDDYGGETFEIVRERDIDGPPVLVDTRILRPRDDPVEVTYVTAELGGRWWIIDIIVGGGISEVKVRRGEYRTLLVEGGLPRLARALTDKADRLLAGKDASQAAGG